MKSDKKYIIFDMDGVLLDTEAVVIECWKKVAEKYGLSNIEDSCRRCIGVNRQESYRIFRETYGPDVDILKLRQEMDNHFFRQMAQGIPTKPYAREFLQYLSDTGYHIALASSTQSVHVHKELTDAGLIDYFDVIVGGDMVETSKPEPDIFLHAGQQLGGAPCETFVIEDSFNGIRAAHAAGMKPLMVPDLLQPDEEIRQLCQGLFSDLSEVQRYFQTVFA